MGYYGFPEEGGHKDSQNFIQSLERDGSIPWCISGDFNDILFDYKMSEGAEQGGQLINRFCQAT